jgi:hypothetical protein
MSLLRKSMDDYLPNYEFSRMMGNGSGAEIDFKSLENQLDCHRDFYKVGIIYADGNQRWLVRPSRRVASPHQSMVTHVVITKVPGIVHAQVEQRVVDAVSSPSLSNEITSTAFACGAMMVTLVLAFSATAVIPLTAGGSGVIAAISKAGALATGVQCVIGGLRLVAIYKGDGSDIAWLDSQNWYIATSTALDVISLAAAGAGLRTTIKTYNMMKSVSHRKATEWLQSLSRPERKRITEQIIRAQNPGIAQGSVKAAIRAGQYPKRFPTESLQRSLQTELTRAVVNSSAFASSAMTGTLRNPKNLATSGNYIFSVVQAFPTL